MSWKNFTLIFFCGLVIMLAIFLIGWPWQVLGAEMPILKDRLFFVAGAALLYGLWLLISSIVIKEFVKKI